MLNREDLENLEKAEQQIDQFVEHHTKNSEEQHCVEAEWAISERRHRERRRERNRELWRAYHLDQADCLEKTAAELAASHRYKAEALLEQGEVDDLMPSR